MTSSPPLTDVGTESVTEQVSEVGTDVGDLLARTNRENERTDEQVIALASNVPAPATSRPHDEPEPDPATPDWPYPDGPTCDHGMPGGNQPDPVLGGRQACPRCARDTARTTRSTR